MVPIGWCLIGVVVVAVILIWIATRRRSSVDSLTAPHHYSSKPRVDEPAGTATLTEPRPQSPRKAALPEPQDSARLAYVQIRRHRVAPGSVLHKKVLASWSDAAFYGDHPENKWWYEFVRELNHLLVDDGLDPVYAAFYLGTPTIVFSNQEDLGELSYYSDDYSGNPIQIPPESLDPILAIDYGFSKSDMDPGLQLPDNTTDSATDIGAELEQASADDLVSPELERGQPFDSDQSDSIPVDQPDPEPSQLDQPDRSAESTTPTDPGPADSYRPAPEPSRADDSGRDSAPASQPDPDPPASYDPGPDTSYDSGPSSSDYSSSDSGSSSSGGSDGS